MTATPAARLRSHEYQDLMRHRIMDILLEIGRAHV